MPPVMAPPTASELSKRLTRYARELDGCMDDIRNPPEGEGESAA